MEVVVEYEFGFCLENTLETGLVAAFETELEAGFETNLEWDFDPGLLTVLEVEKRFEEHLRTERAFVVPFELILYCGKEFEFDLENNDKQQKCSVGNVQEWKTI